MLPGTNCEGMQSYQVLVEGGAADLGVRQAGAPLHALLQLVLTQLNFDLVQVCRVLKEVAPIFAEQEPNGMLLKPLCRGAQVA